MLVLLVHYNTNANPDSPYSELPDTILERVELDDAMQLQMFEKNVFTNPDVRAYDCRIAPKAVYLTTPKTNATYYMGVVYSTRISMD
jgi:hypothetical protein